VKRELQRICCRLYLFSLLDNIIKEGLAISLWTYPKLGEPRISVSLLFYVFSVFIFLQYIMCFIAL